MSALCVQTLIVSPGKKHIKLNVLLDACGVLISELTHPTTHQPETASYYFVSFSANIIPGKPNSAEAMVRTCSTFCPCFCMAFRTPSYE